jgi:hypothetical protein
LTDDLFFPVYHNTDVSRKFSRENENCVKLVG